MADKPSSNEQIAERVRIFAVNLLQTGNTHFRQEVLPLLQAMEGKLIGRLASSGVESKGSLTDFGRRRVQQLLEFTQKTIKSTYGEISGANTEFLTGIAEVESIFIRNAVNQAADIELLTEVPAPEKLKGIVKNSPISGAPSETWWTRQAVETQKRFSDIIQQGMYEGKTNEELVRDVRGTRANKFKDGLLEVSSRNAKALVRSSVQQVANKTRLDTLNTKKNSQLFKGIQQVSTLDSRTSDICIAYSGKMWTIPGYEPIGHALPFNGGPPRHWNCRSTIIPVMKSWQELGIDLEEAAPTTRASMDGQVAADITFDEWLKTKGRTFQDELLGPGRADLWRQGKISLTDLVEGTGKKARSLADLRSLANE